MKAIVSVVFVALLWCGSVEAETPPNYNSSDAGCNPSDPTVLFCEGFETPNPGAGPLCNLRLGPFADDLGANTFDNCAKGWGVHIPDPGGGWTRGSKSPFGSHSAYLTDGAGSTGYDHGFVGGAAVQELYVRWYHTFPVGWSIGQYKLMSPNDHGPNGAGLVWGNLHLGCGAGSPASTRELQWQAPVPEDVCYSLGLDITGGHLYFMELRIKVSSPAEAANGVIQFWGKDCGTTLTSVGDCTGTAPLLFTKTDIRMPSNGTNIKTLWWEGWCSGNPACNSIDSWIDEILVKTTGPIGYAGSTGGSSNGSHPSGTKKMSPMINLRRGS